MLHSPAIFSFVYFWYFQNWHLVLLLLQYYPVLAYGEGPFRLNLSFGTIYGNPALTSSSVMHCGVTEIFIVEILRTSPKPSSLLHLLPRNISRTGSELLYGLTS